jgi:hypothetical protein
VLLGSSQSRTLALLPLHYAYGGQFERPAVVLMLTVDPWGSARPDCCY